jgi:hypothetical protein
VASPAVSTVVVFAVLRWGPGVDTPRTAVCMGRCRVLFRANRARRHLGVAITVDMSPSLADRAALSGILVDPEFYASGLPGYIDYVSEDVLAKWPFLSSYTLKRAVKRAGFAGCCNNWV